MSKVFPASVAVLLLNGMLPAGAVASDFTCFVLERGETAARAAIRLSGAAWHVREPWFQIFDPAAAVFVAKADYDQIRAGWRACLANDHVRPDRVAPPLQPPRPAVQPLAGDVAWQLATMPEAWWALSLVLMVAAASDLAAIYSPAGRARTRALTRFGQRFVREFERPLIRPMPGDRAVESRLRVSPVDRRLDILLAPHAGRIYPNLSDHKTNVEYDIARVLHALGDERFVLQRLGTEGRWVMLRCRAKAGAKLEGGS